MNVMVAMDVSRSMTLGTTTHSKREAMTYITGSILFSALSDQINTGFRRRFRRQGCCCRRSRKRTRDAAWSVLEAGLGPEAVCIEDADAALVRHLATTLKRMSVVFIVSDFVTRDEVLGESRGSRTSPHKATTSSRSCRGSVRRPSCRRGRGTCTCGTSNRAGGCPSGLGRQARRSTPGANP